VNAPRQKKEKKSSTWGTYILRDRPRHITRYVKFEKYYFMINIE
jgi:hypothetical protein